MASTITKLALPKMSRIDVAFRTEVLTNKLLEATTSRSRANRIGELNRHLMEFPASRMVAVKNPFLVKRLLGHLKVEKAAKGVDEEESMLLEAEARQCLTLCGYVHPPKGRGVNILTIDGGGTRGMMGLEVLDALEKHAGGKKIADLFDLIVGVSTGAIIACLVGAKKMPIAEARTVYKDISQQLFTQGKFSGVSGLLLSHSWYNTKKWVEILKKTVGEDLTMIGTSRERGMPKLAYVSCIVNTPQLQPYLFRNYDLPAERDSRYRGTTQHKMWQAIQASAAAPGYFEEVQIESILHQDGGVLCNNPTAIALHEAHQLWPDEELKCVISVGNGRSVVEVDIPPVPVGTTRIHEKFKKLIDSATDTQLIHNCVLDLLPAHVYFRLNPYMSAPYTLDEILPERLSQMERDAQLYVRRNQRKIAAAASQLVRQIPLWKHLWRRFLLLCHGKWSVLWPSH